jgi:hypothetical protein
MICGFGRWPGSSSGDCFQAAGRLSSRVSAAASSSTGVVAGTSGCTAGTTATSTTTSRSPGRTLPRDRLPEHEPAHCSCRLDQLDLLCDPADIRLTRTVLDEIRDKQDEVAARVSKLTAAMPPAIDQTPVDRVDPTRALCPGERRVLAYAVATGPSVLCILDDAAARAEARRLPVSFTGTLGLVLRAKAAGKWFRPRPRATSPRRGSR